MAIDYSRYRPDLSGLTYAQPTTGRGGLMGSYPASARNRNVAISRIRRYFKTPRNYQKNAAGLGYVLPRIGGLRLRDINTAQGRRTAITGGPGNFVYGFTDRSKYKIGRDAQGRIALVARDGKGGTGGGTSATTPGTPAAPPDPYAKYDKDYKWIGDYLRSLKGQEEAFGSIFKNEFQPSVSAALTSMGNLATGAADRYARAAAAGAAANQAAANLAPVQAAGSTEAFDPIGLAAEQAASRATGAAAAENARLGATMSALAPVSAGQGILGNIQRGYAAISSEYANKRIEDQMKLEQWIKEQESAALDREVQQQYNLGLLSVQRGELDLAKLKESNRSSEAASAAQREGQKTNAELAAAGFKRVPKNPGAGSIGTINATSVTSVEGAQWFKPGGGGRGGSGGSGGGTPDQQTKYIKSLAEAYSGEKQDLEGRVFDTGTGYKESSSPDEQATRVYAHLANAIRGGLFGGKKIDRARVREIIAAAITDPKVKVSKDGETAEYGMPDKAALKNQSMTQYIQNIVINGLSKAGLLSG